MQIAAPAADRYDEAVAHPGRSAEDLERDTKDLPVRVLRLAGIKPGMHVLDVLGGNGYYSECRVTSSVPRARAAVNNAGFDGYDTSWKQRLADNRLPNVTHRSRTSTHASRNCKV